MDECVVRTIVSLYVYVTCATLRYVVSRCVVKGRCAMYQVVPCATQGNWSLPVLQFMLLWWYK